MHDDDRRDLAPNLRIRAALAERFGEATRSEADWSSLQSRIEEAARFRLMQRRSTWRTPAERWARRLIPVGLAASVLLAAGVVFAPEPASVGDEDAPGMAEAVAVAASDALPADPLAVSGREAFLSAVLASRSEP